MDPVHLLIVLELISGRRQFPQEQAETSMGFSDHYLHPENSAEFIGKRDPDGSCGIPFRTSKTAFDRLYYLRGFTEVSIRI